MKIAIMQPYFFPYIGYFQLIGAVDKFIFLDDVNFINKGWINRNNILLNAKPFRFTIPLKNASQNRKINEIEIVTDSKLFTNFLKIIEQAYKNAPNYEIISELLHQLFTFEIDAIGNLAKQSIILTCQYIGLNTHFINSSAEYKNDDLKGENRIIDICSKEKADTYINPMGGLELYNSKIFIENSIELKFIKPAQVKYDQFGEEFVPLLSIIDILMFNSKELIQKFLREYELFCNP